MPTPESAKISSTAPSSALRVAIESRPPVGIASRALTARLTITCSIWPGSARTVPRSGSGRKSMATSSPRSRSSRGVTSATTAFRSRGRGWSTWRRPNASSWRVRPEARSAARLISSRSRRNSLSPFARSSRSDAYPVIPVSRLLKSWATPPASRPSDSSFCAFSRSDSSRFRSVTSRRNAMLRPGMKPGCVEASAVRTAPSARCVSHSSNAGPDPRYIAQSSSTVSSRSGGRKSSSRRPIRSGFATPRYAQPAGFTST